MKKEDVILETETEETDQKNEKSWKAYISMVVFLVVLAMMVAFFIGILPIAPVAIATGSMEPAIQIGDVAVVNRMDTEDLEVGDIIEFHTEEYSVIHRIVGRQTDEEGNTSYITKGDYNNAPDSDSVIPEQVKGTVITVIPKIGKISLWRNGF